MDTSWLESEGAFSLLSNALCSDLINLGLMSYDAWFPVNQNSSIATAICRTGCPVRELCLAAGILQDLTYMGTTKVGYGIWGGRTAKERLQIAQRARRALEEKGISTGSKRKES